MSVRAKFQVQRIESSVWSKHHEADAVGPAGYRNVEMRTVVLGPVMGGSDENKRFWDASPSGEIRLGTINPDAWKQFELGKEYYIDFTPAG